MQNKGILISDAHIKSRLWTNFPQIQGDAYQALSQIQGEQGKSDFIISCGDLFDSNRPSSTDLEAVSNLMRSVECFYYINGNHDDVVPSIVPSLGTNAVHLGTVPVKINEVPVFGIDYCNNKDLLIEALSEVASELPLIDSSIRPVLILHQSLDVFFMSFTITLQEIRDILGRPCDIFVGDIHDRKTIESSQGFCQSPGPLVPQDIGQAKKQQAATWVDFSSGTHVEISDLFIKVRNYHFLESPDELDKTYAWCTKVGKYTYLPNVIVLKADASYKIPARYKDDNIIYILDTTAESIKKEAVVKATASSLEEAVKAEAAASGGDTVEILTKLLIKLMHSEVPDEVLLELLKKWKVVMV